MITNEIVIFIKSKKDIKNFQVIHLWRTDRNLPTPALDYE